MVKFCSLFSGSSGNSIYVESNNTKLLIDCGVSGKKVINSLKTIGIDAEEINGILVTHEHRDHVNGVGVLSRKYNIPIYSNEKTWDAMGSIIGEVDQINRKNICPDRKFYIQDVLINPFGISHDAADPVGYSLNIDGIKITIATDMGYISREVVKNFEGSDIMLVESNHDEDMLMCGSYPYPLKRRIKSRLGHLSNELAGKLVAYMYEKGTKNFLLGHLSKENNFPDLAYKTVYNILKSKNINVEENMVLDVAQREQVSKIYSL